MINNKKYYDCNNQNPLTGDTIKALILGEDFLVAWWVVAVYILRYKCTNYHRKLMKFQYDNQDTLILSGRGLGKSSLCSTAFVLTKILKNNELRIAIITATKMQSTDFVGELRSLFEKETIISEIFGDLRGLIWRNDKFSLKRTGIYKEATVNCASMNASGNVISKHFNLILLDDSVGFDNCETQLKRDRFKRFIDNSVTPTLIEEQKFDNETVKGQIKIIGTHYNGADYYAELSEAYESNKNAKYKVLKVPSLVRDKNTGAYKSVCPGIKSTKYLLKEKANMDSKSFNMQYMAKVDKSNSPYFKNEYFQYFNSYKIDAETNKVFIRRFDYRINKNEQEERYVTETEVRIFMGVDLAIAQTKTSDKFCITVIGIDKEKNIYLMDIYADKISFNEQQEAIKKYYDKWKMTIRIGIDSTSYQQVLAAELKRTTNLPIKAIKLTKNKENRISVFSAQWENLKVFLYKDRDGKRINDLEILEDECYAFPNAKHDDTIDSFCLAWELSQGYNDDDNFDVEAFSNAFL